MIGGIALALKAAFPKIHVVGVTMEKGPAMVLSLKAGKPVEERKSTVSQPALVEVSVLKITIS